MSDRNYSFDPKCLELAEHFLPADASDSQKSELAQCLQDCAEDFCAMHEVGLEPVADREVKP